VGSEGGALYTDQDDCLSRCTPTSSAEPLLSYVRRTLSSKSILHKLNYFNSYTQNHSYDTIHWHSTSPYHFMELAWVLDEGIRKLLNQTARNRRKEWDGNVTVMDPWAPSSLPQPAPPSSPSPLPPSCPPAGWGSGWHVLGSDGTALSGIPGRRRGLQVWVLGGGKGRERAQNNFSYLYFTRKIV